MTVQTQRAGCVFRIPTKFAIHRNGLNNGWRFAIAVAEMRSLNADADALVQLRWNFVFAFTCNEHFEFGLELKGFETWDAVIEM